MSSGVYGYLASGDDRVVVLELASDGSLSPIQQVPVRGDELIDGDRTGQFMSLAISPDRRYLFASNRSAPHSFRSYAIDRRDGTLTRLSDAPAVDSSPYITTDSTGRWLLAAYNPPSRRRTAGYVSVSAISDGFLMAPHQVLQTPPKAHAIRPDRSNRFVYTPVCNGDVVMRYGFDAATGSLDPDSFAPLHLRPKTGPRHIVVHPSNRLLFLLNEYDATICAYGLDPATGAVSELQVASVFPSDLAADANPRAGDLKITPDGRWLYAALRANCTIAVVGIDQRTGELTPAGHFGVDKEPRGFAVDPFGRFLVTNGLMTGTATTFAIDEATGALNQVAQLEGVRAPNWMEFAVLA